MEIVLNNGESIEVNQSVFDREFNPALVHQVVQTYLSNGHRGSKAQKSRSDVRASGRKPWRQKGTGRARSGTRASPIWRGGGVTFAASPTVRQRKLNRKMYRHAMCCILSQLCREQRLTITSEFDVDSPKTKNLRQALDQLKLSHPLIIHSKPSTNLQRAAANLQHVQLASPQHLDLGMMLRSENILIDVDSIRQLEAQFA